MAEIINDAQNTDQEFKVANRLNNQGLKQMNVQKVKKLGKCFNIVDSPEIVFDLCDVAYQKSRYSGQQSHFFRQKEITTKISLQQSRKNLQRKGYRSNKDYLFTPKQSQNLSRQFNEIKFSDKSGNLDERMFYIQIKNKMKQFIQKIQSQKQIKISEVLILKQDILSSFFSQIIDKVKRQCKQKGGLIHYIWNSMFSILQLVISQLTRRKNEQQRQYLSQNLQNHKKYQDMLQYDKQKIQTLKQNIKQALVFQSTLVFDLRCKRRQLRKAYQKLKICTNKLNQNKQNCLQLQKDHIDLLMDTKDISQQMAQYLLKRRQQIYQQKKKTFRLNFSKKSNYQNTKKQVQSQPNQQAQKIGEQLRIAFNKQYNRQNQFARKENKELKQLTNFMFEDAMDQFAFYQNNDQTDDDFMASRQRTTFIDAQTDMIGFQPNVNDKYCQVDYIQKIVQGISKNRGDQTVSLQQKVRKIFVQSQVQVQQFQLNQLKFQVYNKVYDLSFLFEKKGSINSSINTFRGSNKDQQLRNNKIQFQDERISNPLKKNGKSQLDINITSKKLSTNKKVITPIGSVVSTFSKNKQLDESNINYFDQNEKNQKQYSENDEENISQVSDTYNFQDCKERFALKKGLRKKKVKLGAQIEKQNISNVDQNYDVDKQGQIFSLIKTKRNSTFSQQRQIKMNSNSLDSHANQRKKNTAKFGSALKYQNQTKIKQLKRQVLSRNSDANSLQASKSRFNQMKFNKCPQKSSLMKILARSRKGKQGFDVNQTIQRIKKQYSNSQMDKQIQEFIKNRQSQDQQQALKNFHTSIQPLIGDLYRNVERAKKHYVNLLPARQRNLCKIISNVYLQAYQLLERKQDLYSLINPLFHYFQIGYGMLKKHDLYSRMVSFLSQLSLYKEESYIFNSFFFFTGMDRQNRLSCKITSWDFHLYLKLLKSLSFSFSLSSGITGLNVQNLYTSNVILGKNTRQVLMEQRLDQTIIEKVITKVHEKLLDLTGVNMSRNRLAMNSTINSMHGFNRGNSCSESSFSRSQSTWNFNRDSLNSSQVQDQIKLDVFKCCQLIMQEIISMKSAICQSYLPLINHVYQKQKSTQDNRVDETLMQFIVKCQFMSKYNQVKCQHILNNLFKINSLYNQYKCKSLENSCADSKRQSKTLRILKTVRIIGAWHQDQNTQDAGKQALSMNDVCSFTLETNVSDFNKTYFNALNLFRLRQDAALKICMARLPQIRKIAQKQNMKILLILLQQINQQTNLDNLMQSTQSFFSQSFNHSITQTFKSQFSSVNKQPNTSTLKLINNKKMLNLCFLRVVQNKVSQTLDDVLGNQLGYLYNYLPLSTKLQYYSPGWKSFKNKVKKVKLFKYVTEAKIIILNSTELEDLFRISLSFYFRRQIVPFIFKFSISLQVYALIKYLKFSTFFNPHIQALSYCLCFHFQPIQYQIGLVKFIKTLLNFKNTVYISYYFFQQIRQMSNLINFSPGIDSSVIAQPTSVPWTKPDKSRLSPRSPP